MNRSAIDELSRARRWSSSHSLKTLSGRVATRAGADLPSCEGRRFLSVSVILREESGREEKAMGGEGLGKGLSLFLVTDKNCPDLRGFGPKDRGSVDEGRSPSLDSKPLISLPMALKKEERRGGNVVDVVHLFL